MVDPTTGLDTSQSVIADRVNQGNVGMSQRQRNELIRQQTQQGISPEMSSNTEYGQALQPNEVKTGTWSSINPDNFGSQKKYESAVLDSIKYNNAGFVPGQQVDGWKYTPSQPIPEWYTNALESKKTAENPNSIQYSGLSGYARNFQDNWSKDGYNLYYDPTKGYTLQQPDSGGGFFGSLIGDVFGGIYDVLDPVLDIVPFNDDLQDWIAKDVFDFNSPREAFQTIAPIVASFYLPSIGAEAGAAGGAAGGTGITTSATGATLGGATTGLQGVMSGLGTTAGMDGALGSGISGSLAGASTAGGLGSLFSTSNPYVNNAINNSIKNFVLSGGDPKAALQGAITGPLTQYLDVNAYSSLGDMSRRMYGGATSGALNSLFTNNNPIRGALYGGMSGGLHGYLNSVNANNDPFNRTLSKVITRMAKDKFTRT